MMTILSREFTSNDRNPNANGNQRLIVVTRNTDGTVQIVISGVQGWNRGLVTLSDVTLDAATWETHSAVILAGA